MAIGKLNKKSITKNIESIDAFLAKAEDNLSNISTIDLSALSLDDLANQFIEIDRQSHILKGQILLEARRRFPSNQEFGKWRSLNFGGRLPQQTANNLMCLAKFFDETNRPLGNIPVSAGYLISAPKHEDIAEQIYERVLTIENPSLAEVKLIIQEIKPVEETNEEEPESLEEISLRINALTKKQLIDLLVTKMTNKELAKLFK
ncbi:hypothetical protein DOJK_01209 [Patescibacteria group bacterium]|nr:hypothetical protein DOJK_01209 [Patescibacteria group bacterium]